MKKISNWLLIVLLLCLTGCGAESDNTEIITNTPAPTLFVSDIFQPEATPGAVDVGSSEVLAEDLEKVDAKELTKYNAANRRLNHDLEMNQNSLFCIDGDTGVIYFVNQKKDYYIYRLKDGVAELAVSVPARELYCYDGILYFMVDSYDRYELKGMKEWDIYAYNPTEGTVELVYALGETMENVEGHEVYFQKLAVNEKGIYFIGEYQTKEIELNGRVVNTTKSYGYCLPFGASEPVMDDMDMTVAGWRDYSAGYLYTEEGIVAALCPRGKGRPEEDIIIGGTHNYFIMEDDVYFLGTGSQKIIRKNLVTGEKKEFDCEPVVRATVSAYADTEKELPQLVTFTITEDSIWIFNSAKYVIQFNRSTGETKCYQLGLSKVVDTVYTDGYSIYALTSSGVAKVLTEEATGSVGDIPELKVEYLVK